MYFWVFRGLFRQFTILLRIFCNFRVFFSFSTPTQSLLTPTSTEPLHSHAHTVTRDFLKNIFSDLVILPIYRQQQFIEKKCLSTVSKEIDQNFENCTLNTEIDRIFRYKIPCKYYSKRVPGKVLNKS